MVDFFSLGVSSRLPAAGVGLLVLTTATLAACGDPVGVDGRADLGVALPDLAVSPPPDAAFTDAADGASDNCSAPCPACQPGTTCVRYPEGPECTKVCKDDRDCPVNRRDCVGITYGEGACVTRTLMNGCNKDQCSPMWRSECDEANKTVIEVEDKGAFCRLYVFTYCPKGCADAPDMGQGRWSARCIQ